MQNQSLQIKNNCMFDCFSMQRYAFKPSHVIRALGRNSEQAFSSIRLKTERFNTKREIDTNVEINKTIDNLKNRKYKGKK